MSNAYRDWQADEIWEKNRSLTRQLKGANET